MNKESVVKRTIIVLLLTVFCAPVQAGIFVCHDESGLITRKVPSGGAAYSINPNCFRITADQYNTVTNATHKASEGALVELTQQEIDDRAAAEAAAIQAAEEARIDLFDSTIATAKISEATLTKIDAKIDAISSLDDAKTFLKKLARYLLNQ